MGRRRLVSGGMAAWQQGMNTTCRSDLPRTLGYLSGITFLSEVFCRCLKFAQGVLVRRSLLDLLSRDFGKLASITGPG